MSRSWGPNQKGQGKRMRDVLIGPGQSSSVTHGFFLVPFPALFFPVLPSLSVPLCVTFLLAPLFTLPSLKCWERLFH